MDAQIIPQEYLPTLERIVAEAKAEGDVEACRTDSESVATVLNIQEALGRYGLAVSAGQAEEVYRMYSQNKWAGWLSGGCKSPEHAVLMLKEFCHDVRFGENHIGL